MIKPLTLDAIVSIQAAVKYLHNFPQFTYSRLGFSALLWSWLEILMDLCAWA
jgi:hypothetical protein